MRKITFLCVILLFTGLQVAFSQQRTITGTVTSKDDGTTLPGVTVVVKATTIGTVTDANGKYTISVPSKYDILVVSFVGMKPQEVSIGNRTTIDVVLETDVMNIEGVVVTALGISREKKSLGYSTQEISGDQVSTVKTDNFINSLSGKVSGVQVKKTTNMGGSTNILLRGSKSLTGENQVLFVVDGVPINNSTYNTSSQQQAGIGYDFGNAASDLNPDDIESINVLKGSAATALYGSRAAGGVVMITTKKGQPVATGTAAKKKYFGVTLNSGVTVGFVDKSTFPTYQQDYGGGYGQYYGGPDSHWYMRYINPDGTITTTATSPDSKLTQWVTTSEDASYGAKFDPNLQVYQWDAVDPQSPNHLKATPWVAAENGPITFFQNPTTYTNSVAIENAGTSGSYRLSYTNFDQKGLQPNSKLTKNNILLNGTWNVTDRLTVAGSGNYIVTKGLGRNSTGYSDNIMGSFRQWMETNVDIKEEKDIYNLTKRNVTWNWADPTDEQPIFWDNIYWTRYENYESDGRNRFVGYLSVNYKVLNWLDLYGRFSADSYTELQEERRAVGSIATPFGIGQGADGSINQSTQASGYLRRDITFSEYNYDLMGNFHKDISKSFNIKGVVGMNIRRTNFTRMISATNGGLVVPEVYSLQNSAGPLPLTKELASKVGVNGIYGSVSLGFKNMIYLDGTLRGDKSSTLPTGKNVYYYPSVAASWIFSNLAPDSKWLSFGKVRVNYAVVGNSAAFDQLVDNYNIITPMNSAITSVAGTKKDPDLLPETTNSLEGGLEMYFIGRRVGFDLAGYTTNSKNQILPLAVSTATGYTYKIINAGSIKNSGVELALNATPIKVKKWKWDLTLNFAKNYNKVVSLYQGVDNLQLGSFQGGITINARVGQPYGVICGTDFVYLNGEKVVDKTTGRYLKTATSDNVIGNENPKWTGGISSQLSYGNWSLSFLVDASVGGSIFSLDMYYGLATGLYKETSYINDKGNPVRNTLADGGGYVNPGVNQDGSTNTTYEAASNYGSFGYRAFGQAVFNGTSYTTGNPDKMFVYDATFVKLRELALSYTIPSTVLKKCFLNSISISAVASNPWIIFKKLPYADPESGLGAGNLQGYTTGSLPSTRDFSLNVKFNF